MPWDAIASGVVGAVSAGTQLAATKYTNDTNYRIARENMGWQQQENERAFQRELQMWDMQNQYNSPESQRRRLEEAGYNAMLMQGSGSNVSPGNSSSSPGYSPAQAITPTMQDYNVGNLGMGVADLIQRIKLNNKNIEQTDAAIAGINADTLVKLQDLKFKENVFEYQVEAEKELLDDIRSKIANRNASTRYTLTQEELARENFKLDSALKKMDLATKDFKLQYEKDVRDFRYVAEQLANEYTRATVGLSQAQKYYYQQKAYEAIQLTEKALNDASLLGLEYGLQKNFYESNKVMKNPFVKKVLDFLMQIAIKRK